MSRYDGATEKHRAESTSALLSILREFLFLFPSHVGPVLVDRWFGVSSQLKQAEWVEKVLAWNAEELIEFIERDGDEEDKMMFVDVFLWKQRHGLIDRGLRIDYQFSRWPDAFYLHRYMVANGYEAVLDAPQYSRQKIGYLQQIEDLLDRFGRTDLSEEDFWGLAMRLNVLGPKLSNDERRGGATEFANYVLKHYANDTRLHDYGNDVYLSTLALLFFDLRMDPTKTWPLFKSAMRRSNRRSISCYPALVVGMDMYGSQLREELQTIAVQGGNDLFYALMEANGTSV